ncbi:MAG TPA: YbaK/EbsC family protein [Candidatus Acetothermia bacterium]|nr:YbaK/EbsC family protein [Candidatus Acetothermia bacterium]
MASLSKSARRVQKALWEMGLPYEVIELPQSTRSAEEAARAVGCEVGQIAKSLVFRGKNSGRPILVIASGKNHVDEEKLSSYLSEPVEKADADFVKKETGFSIGGVPPIGHAKPLVTFIDEDLLGYEEIWAAAGTPNAVFKLSSRDLAAFGRIVPIKAS